MPIEVLMPALSPTMEEGTLARWLVAEGDSVAPGDVIAEIETDKATMEVEAVEEGVVGKLAVAEGTEGVKVNAVIALLLEEGEDASAALAAGGGEARGPGGAAGAANPCPRRTRTGRTRSRQGCCAGGSRAGRAARVSPR